MTAPAPSPRPDVICGSAPCPAVPIADEIVLVEVAPVDAAEDGLRLSRDDVTTLAVQIEVGLLARDARLSGRGFGDASESELWALEQEGVAAHSRFVRSNLALVAMVVKPAAGSGPEGWSDLFQEGCLGLLTAIERFDYRRGYRFSTYALFWIRAFVQAASSRQLGAANLPVTRASQLRGARGLETVLTQELGRAATVTEIAAALGRPAGWTADLLAHQAPTSLETLDEQVLDRWHSCDETDRVLDRQFRMEDLLARLDQRSRRVLELRLGLAGSAPVSFAQTGRVLRMSATNVRRVEATALDRLRAICPQQVSSHLRSA